MPGTNDEVSCVNSPLRLHNRPQIFCFIRQYRQFILTKKESKLGRIPLRLFLSTCLSTTDWHIGANGQVSAELASKRATTPTEAAAAVATKSVASVAAEALQSLQALSPQEQED